MAERVENSKLSETVELITDHGFTGMAQAMQIHQMGSTTPANGLHLISVEKIKIRH